MHLREFLKQEMERNVEGCGKKHERKCRGTSRDMGRNVKESHSEVGKSQKTIFAGS